VRLTLAGKLYGERPKVTPSEGAEICLVRFNPSNFPPVFPQVIGTRAEPQMANENAMAGAAPTFGVDTI